MKKKEIVIGVSVLISASLPISVYAASNESMSSRGFIIDETNEFEDIVKQILDVKSKHPEWSEQQISDFMDQIHAIKKDGVIDIWNALTSSEKKFFIGGRNMNGLLLAMTTMATYTSVSSFISGPGAAGLTYGYAQAWIATVQVPITFLVLGVLGNKLALVSRRTGAVTVVGYLKAR